MKKGLRYLCISLLSVCVQASADVNGDLNRFFDDLGFQGNVTGPHAYQGQQAGYFSGGNLYFRNQTRNVQLMHIDLPKFRGGCGGIDATFGAFSVIDGDEIIELGRNIINNAKGFSFNLALESSIPMVQRIKEGAEQLERLANNHNIDTCHTATALVGSLWPKTEMAQREVCKEVGTKGSGDLGLFDDFADAQQQCGIHGKMSETLNRAYRNPAMRDRIVNGNMVWRAMMEHNDFLKSDPQLAELFMSLSGTLIYQLPDSDDSSPHQAYLPPLLKQNSDLVKAIIDGGKATIYHCDNRDADKCFNPTLETLSIQESNGLANRIRTLLEDMIDKIYTDTELSQEEIGLVNSTRLPILKMLSVEAAYRKDKDILDVSRYTHAIATDLLLQYLTESLNSVEASVHTLQYPTKYLAQFQSGLNRSYGVINQVRKKSYEDMVLTYQMMQETRVLERSLSAQLSANLNQTLAWAQGLKR